jgi:hypothetical protein
VEAREGHLSSEEGSIFGRVFFSILSLSDNIKNRHLRYLEGKSLINNQIEILGKTKAFAVT